MRYKYFLCTTRLETNQIFIKSIKLIKTIFLRVILKTIFFFETFIRFGIHRSFPLRIFTREIELFRQCTKCLILHQYVPFSPIHYRDEPLYTLLEVSKMVIWYSQKRV